MKKITFIDNVTLADADTMNTLQNNAEEAINGVESNSNNKIKLINNRIDDLNTYDENEKKIGIWFKKPLYRKITTINGFTAGKTSTNHGIANVENIWIDHSTSFINSISDNENYPIPMTLYATNTDMVTFSTTKTSINIQAQTGWGSDRWKVYLTLLYTKTTDEEVE